MSGEEDGSIRYQISNGEQKQRILFLNTVAGSTEKTHFALPYGIPVVDQAELDPRGG